jgi:phosphoserine phosphatase RsbU/P
LELSSMDARRFPQILIVDDDQGTRRMIQTVLNRAGLETACAANVSEALAATDTIYPDLILLDVNLPDGSGFDMCREFHRRPGASRTPVLFISADNNTNTKVQAFDSGAVDYITKPIAGAELLARVTTHLKLRQARDTLAELQAERIQRLASAQKAVMPKPEEFPEAHFAVLVEQVLEAGGDFYDVVRVGDRITDYLVADASGHDLAASFWTAALKTLVMEYATPLNSPRDILHTLNGALGRILPPGVFFTLVYVRLNRRNGKLSLACAGHPPLINIPGNGNPPSVVRVDGDVVGAFSDAGFGSHESVVRPGDRLLLYSDGLIEVDGSFESGLSRVLEGCNKHRGLPLDLMIGAIRSEAIGENQVVDDIVLMGVEV